MNRIKQMIVFFSYNFPLKNPTSGYVLKWRISWMTYFNVSIFSFCQIPQWQGLGYIKDKYNMATSSTFNESYSVLQANVTAYNIPWSNCNQEQIFSTAVKIEQYALPVICIFGLIGNWLSPITFFKRPLRRAPCSLYLAIRGLSGNGFLKSSSYVGV